MEENVTLPTGHPVSHPSQKLTRDLRLDFWRGLCIVDMVMVHLARQGLAVGAVAAAIIIDYTRFAAGGFVFVSGFCVGAIHLHRARNAARRSGVYLGMLRRAGFILLAHYLATLTELILCPIAGKRLNLGQTLHDTLLLRQGYDLLPFYVCMIALSPLLLEMLRRGLWWIVSAASVAAFVAGSSNPWLMGFPLQHDFFPLLWQLIFVAGMLAGSQLTNYDRLSVKTKSQVALVVGLLSILLTLAARLEAGGVVLPAHLTFLKVPLSVGEAMRYVAIILTILIGSDLLWNRIDGSAISRFVNRLGRRSLGMAMIHVWVVIGALRLADAVQPAAPWAMALMAATVGALGLIARSLDALAEFWRGWQPRWPRLEYVAVPTLAVVVFVILAVANPPDPARATVQFEQVAVASPRVATYSRTQPMRSIQIARRATAGGITRSKAS